ncbi:MAG TPA: hypothetical protein DET40_21020 [Lentisphaeria bacterium]|nr:MAG: hypothetical protein A2X45_15640 [Lentisphaerae bacterium GWF2_50_93]HCE46035.1 hypothetical protein [Lentisphaeria bacterium]
MKLLQPDIGRRVRFKFSAEPGNQVSVAGTFNKWSPTANPLMDSQGAGNYKTVMCIPAGMYEYKFVVNGAWFMDPRYTGRVPNAYGSQNSVLHVPCFKNGLSAWGSVAEVQVIDPSRLPDMEQDEKTIKINPLKHLRKRRKSTRRELIAGGGIGIVFLILFVLIFMGRV